MKGHTIITLPSCVVLGCGEVEDFIKKIAKKYDLKQHWNINIDLNTAEINLYEPSNPLATLLTNMEGAK